MRQLLRETLKKSPNDPEKLCRRANLLRCIGELKAAETVRDLRAEFALALAHTDTPGLVGVDLPIRFALTLSHHPARPPPPPPKQLYERAAELDNTADQRFVATFAHFLFETNSSKR